VVLDQNGSQVLIVHPESLPEDNFEGPEFQQYASTQINNTPKRYIPVHMMECYNGHTVIMCLFYFIF